MSVQNKIPCHCSGSAREQAACRDRHRCYNPEDGVNDIAVLIDSISEHITDALFSNSEGKEGNIMDVFSNAGEKVITRTPGFTKRLVKEIISQYI